MTQRNAYHRTTAHADSCGCNSCRSHPPQHHQPAYEPECPVYFFGDGIVLAERFDPMGRKVISAEVDPSLVNNEAADLVSAITSSPELNEQLATAILAKLTVAQMTTALSAASTPALLRAWHQSQMSALGSGWTDADGKYGENDALRNTAGFTNI